MLTKADIEMTEPTPTEDPPVPVAVSESVPPDTPTTEPKPAPPAKRGGRPPGKGRGGRGGRNAHPRDAPTPVTNGASPAANDTPNSPQIGVVNGTGNGHESSDGTGATSSKPARSKNWRLEKLSWHDIRRPAGAMQNYIAQRQVEMAVEKHSPAPAVETPSALNGGQNQEEAKIEDGLDVFKKLSTLQMMDDLSRDLVHWQRMVAEQNEK